MRTADGKYILLGNRLARTLLREIEDLGHLTYNDLALPTIPLTADELMQLVEVLVQMHRTVSDLTGSIHRFEKHKHLAQFSQELEACKMMLLLQRAAYKRIRREQVNHRLLAKTHFLQSQVFVHRPALPTEIIERIASYL